MGIVADMLDILLTDRDLDIDSCLLLEGPRQHLVLLIQCMTRG